MNLKKLKDAFESSYENYHRYNTLLAQKLMFKPGDYQHRDTGRVYRYQDNTLYEVEADGSLREVCTAGEEASWEDTYTNIVKYLDETTQD